MTLALFDLDHTLIDGDTEVSWGDFLGEQGWVEPLAYRREALRFFDLYKSGRLDVDEFLDFQLNFLGQHPVETLLQLRQQWVEAKLRPMLLTRAQTLVDEHKQQGHTTLIITASSRFIAEPAAELYGVHGLIATEAEMRDGRFTGKSTGLPSFAAGKVTRLEQWMEDNAADLRGSWFYSDSHNDLPLLRLVENPVAVHPDPILAAEAVARGWPVIHLTEYS
ncbi:MAG: HAD family hydrolase [Gammaproteobacteria bacterium]